LQKREAGSFEVHRIYFKGICFAARIVTVAGVIDSSTVDARLLGFSIQWITRVEKGILTGASAPTISPRGGDIFSLWRLFE